MDKLSRRDLVKASAGAVAGLAAMAADARAGSRPRCTRRVAASRRRGSASPSSARNHNHIFGQVGAATRGGGEFVAYYVREPEIRADFAKRYPNVKAVADERAILEDQSIQLVLSSIIPDRARAARRARDAARQGLHVRQAGHHHDGAARGSAARAEGDEAHLLDPVQRAARGRRRGEGGRAGEGRRDRHRRSRPSDSARTAVTPTSRPEWFWDVANYGGILCDIGSHQFDQFLFFTGSTSGEIVASQVRNVNHPDHPKFQDFGDVMVRGNGGTGYIRMDWFTPDGLSTWGDGRHDHPRHRRLHRAAEVRRHRRPARRQPSLHRRSEGDELHRLQGIETPYGSQLVDDVLNRTETAMSQAHCFLASELAIRAQDKADAAEAGRAPSLSEWRTHEWVGGKPPTHSRSLRFVQCAPPAPRPLPFAIPLRALSPWLTPRRPRRPGRSPRSPLPFFPLRRAAAPAASRSRRTPSDSPA